ncbi:hypothetical protein [Cryobacterium sp. MLB-32]|nr:hypothetical protein [Cryobacterium sp. MLB-32]
MQQFAKADKIIRAAKSVAKAYAELGGTVSKVVDLIKKYVRNKASLTQK